MSCLIVNCLLKLLSQLTTTTMRIFRLMTVPFRRLRSRNRTVTSVFQIHKRQNSVKKLKQYPDVLSSLQVKLTEYSMILSCLRQNIYEQKDIPFRVDA